MIIDLSRQHTETIGKQYEDTMEMVSAFYRAMEPEDELELSDGTRIKGDTVWGLQPKDDNDPEDGGMHLGFGP